MQAKLHVTKLIKLLSSKSPLWKTFKTVKFRSHYSNKNPEMFYDKWI